MFLSTLEVEYGQFQELFSFSLLLAQHFGADPFFGHPQMCTERTRSIPHFSDVFLLGGKKLTSLQISIWICRHDEGQRIVQPKCNRQNLKNLYANSSWYDNELSKN